MNTPPSAPGLIFPMRRGPFQNNGATPWYATIALGTPGQPLKFALDSGTNITWITSTLCPPDQCIHFGGGRFDYQASSSFAFTDCLQRPYSFGPWGSMQVETAVDLLSMPDGGSLLMQFFVAAGYTGEQFKQLNWDGGIGLPCSSAYVEGRSSCLFQELIRSRQIDPSQPYVAFDWDAAGRQGSCQLGAVDPAKTQGAHVFLPWSVYTTVPGVEYIWSTPLTSYSVGGATLATDLTFALDSGSSQFKGDDAIMRQTLARIAQEGRPDVVLGFADGEITLGADLYNIPIEEGPQQGQTVAQFAPLGLTDLVLVGSLVMEHCYSVFEYQVVRCAHGAYSLAPVGIWLFNRPDGPQIITRASSRRFMPGLRVLATGKVSLPGPAPARSVAGTWKNDYGSVMTLNVAGNRVTGTYQSSTGSTGRYKVVGYQLASAAPPNQGLPVALAIEWHSTAKGPADPSWHWSSGLCGQMSLDGSEDLLDLSHLLVASSDFAGLAQPGTYVDALRYRRCSTALTETPDPMPAVESDTPLTGTWLADDGKVLEVVVHAEREGRFGRVTGRLAGPWGSIEVAGFTDIGAAAGGLSQQSVAITAAQDKAVLALSGWLKLDGDVLELSLLSTVSTLAAQRYVQTRLSSVTFRRAR